VTVPATNLSGQVINVRTTGLYYFDGTAWQPVSKDVDPIEYYILLTFDSNSTASLAATSTWTEPRNQWANTNNYLTSSKNYTIGSKTLEGLKDLLYSEKSTVLLMFVFVCIEPTILHLLRVRLLLILKTYLTI
jgi:hypothetical protein